MVRLNKNIIVGLDLSLTSPGMSAVRTGNKPLCDLLDTGNVKTTSSEDWYSRQKAVYQTIVAFVVKHRPAHIIVENYAFGSTNGREIAGEVNGIVLLKLIEAGYPLERIHKDVAPTTLKNIITGSSKATKAQVVKAINELFGLNLKTAQNDIADAIGLAYIGHCIQNFNYIDLSIFTKSQLKSFKTIQEKLGGKLNG
jgi:Holliday junction resolvasome RuvABC endonuclease subunit